MKRYQFILENSSPEPAAVEWGYFFYGVLMRLAPPEFAAALHESGPTPLSQHALPTGGGRRVVWEVCLLTETAAAALDAPLAKLREIHLEKKNILLPVAACHVTEGAAVTVPETESRAARCEILTPAAFKSGDAYAFFPTPALLINSLIQKWNAAQRRVVVADEEALRALLAGLHISGYRLYSRYYGLKNVKIPAFMGSFTLAARLPAPLMELYRMLLGYAAWSGIGIKTALGMGAVRIDWK